MIHLHPRRSRVRVAPETPTALPDVGEDDHDAVAAPNSGTARLLRVPESSRAGSPAYPEHARGVLLLPFDPSPDSRRLLFGWRPPMPFPVRVRYWGARAPVELWTCPFLVDDQGRVVMYLAAGPAGRHVNEARWADVDESHFPRGVRVQMITEANTAGTLVYAIPAHTAN